MSTKRHSPLSIAAIALAAAGLAGCAATATTTATSGGAGIAQVSHPKGPYPLAQQTLGKMVAADPSIRSFIKSAYGFAVFPTVSKGALIVGGSYGEGAAFRKDTKVAQCSISQGSIGFQVGGKAYSEVIFFKTRPYFDQFIAGNFSFDTGVSAVAVTAGAAANVTYSNGIAVFSLPKGGLMASAAVGGQNFDCTPANKQG